MTEGYKICGTCDGDGAIPLYQKCNNNSNECCGGCDYEYRECPDCYGSGEIEIDEDEE